MECIAPSNLLFSCFLIIYKIKVCILLCFRFGHIGFRLYLKLSVINFRPVGQTCI